MIQFTWYTFSQLSVEQLYAVLKLRSAIFVVEQNCVYLDMDDRDHAALHLLGYDDSQTLVAYLRLFPPTEVDHSVNFGRIVTAGSVRSKSYGKALMKEMLTYAQTNFPGLPITCSAQARLTTFYQGFGFKERGEPYLEDGIPHIAMQKDA